MSSGPERGNVRANRDAVHLADPGAAAAALHHQRVQGAAGADQRRRRHLPPGVPDPLRHLRRADAGPVRRQRRAQHPRGEQDDHAVQGEDSPGPAQSRVGGRKQQTAGPRGHGHYRAHKPEQAAEHELCCTVNYWFRGIRRLDASLREMPQHLFPAAVALPTGRGPRCGVWAKERGISASRTHLRLLYNALGEMEVKLLNGLVFHCHASLPFTAGDLLSEMRNVYKLPATAVFVVLNGREPLQENSVVTENRGLRVLPLRLSLADDALLENEFALQQVFQYCFQMYQESRWPCSDSLLIRLFCIAHAINQETALVRHANQLLPERQRALFDYYHQRLARLSFELEKNKFYQFIKLIRSSAYFGFALFPVLDLEQDWTSLLGISEDGIVLIDAELGTAYMYLQADYFWLKMKAANVLSVLVNPELAKIRTQEDFEHFKAQVEQAEQKKPKIIDFIANTTKGLDLPVFSMLPDESREGVARGARFRQFKVQQTEKFIARMNQGPESDANTLLQNAEIIPVRGCLTLKFESDAVCASVFDYIQGIQTNFDPLAQHPRRSLRIMSDSTLELFKQLYLNNCVKYCVRPLQTLLQRVDDVLDGGAARAFGDISILREKITHMHVRSLVQAVLAALDFNPLLGSFRVDSVRAANSPDSGAKRTVIVTRRLNPQRITRLKTGTTRFFRGGAGTPYDPFVPIHFGLARNLSVQRAAFISSEFSSIAWVQEVVPLLQHPAVCASLKALEIADNLVMNKGAIILASRCAGLTALRALHLSNCKMKQTGLSCLLYLLDSQNIYLLQLSLQGVKCHTKAAFQQLGIYVGRCWKRYGSFERLDLSGCPINHVQAQGFVAGCLIGAGQRPRQREQAPKEQEDNQHFANPQEGGRAPIEREAQEQGGANISTSAQASVGMTLSELESTTATLALSAARPHSPAYNNESNALASSVIENPHEPGSRPSSAILAPAQQSFIIETLVCKRCFQGDALAQENMQQISRSLIEQ